MPFFTDELGRRKWISTKERNKSLTLQKLVNLIIVLRAAERG